MSSQLALPWSQDDESRRQIRDLLDQTLFVEAGAGTGKTSALVDRYVALVLAGRRVEQLVAITFTEKAAAELRDRVRGELERRDTASPGQPLIRDALDNLDRAQISTIHAFALTALRSFAAETGINPTFAVQDEVAAERRFEDAWRAYLDELGSDDVAREAINRVLELGMWTSDLEKLAHALWQNTALAEMLDAAPLPVPEVDFPDLEDLRRRLEELDLDSVAAADRLVPIAREVLHGLDELIAADPADRDSVLATIVPGLKNASGGQAGNWRGVAIVANARVTTNEVSEALRNGLNSLRSEALGMALPLVVRFVIQESQRRLRDGGLVYEDLILRLRNLLRDRPEARRRLRARYRTLLIDEFQDTDPLQTDITLAFASDPDTGAIEHGRIFLVGDPKQSIYRFRRADMAVYSETRLTLEAARSGMPQLAQNRRSRGVVLEFVNTVFQRVIGAGAEPSLQPPYRPVHPERGVQLRGPDVGYIGGVVEAPAREARRVEATQVAAYCRAALEQDWQVEDRIDKQVRPARYRDIAILVPTRAILQPLEQALSAAGVPYRVEGGSLVYATQEVRDLINCLTAIDDPTDEVAVAGALRSTAYACSDVELGQHRLAGGGFNYLAPSLEAAAGPVSTALLDLREVHQRRHQGGLAGLVERFIAGHAVVEGSLYDAANRNAFRRARFVIEQARAFEADAPASLRSFVSWLERRAGDAILDHEGAALDDDEDAVRVLTVHGAKGLEFPIVFLAGLGVGATNNQHAVLGLDRASDAIGVSIGSRTTRKNQFTLGPVDEINAQESRHEIAERDRLLYVAATRARDHLIVSLYHHVRARDSGAERLISSGAMDAATRLPELVAITDTSLLPFSGLEPEVDDRSDDEFEAARAALARRLKQRFVTSATGLARLRKPAAPPDPSAEVDDEDEREDETEPWARGRAGTHRGRAVHAALQVLPWDADDETIEALARAQAVVEAIPEQADDVARLLRAALRTDAAARARTAKRSLREVPFAFADGSVTLEGFIDLVIETDDGMEIVDWKTDALSEAAVDQRLESYRLQAGLYVLGIEAATSQPVRRVTYVFVTPGVERSPGEASTLAALAQDELRRLVTSA